MGFPTVVLQGDARARGRQYADQAGDRVRRSLASYQRRLGRPWNEVRRTVRSRFLPAIAIHLPEALAEIEALARGVGCDVADILAIEARYELLRLADGCTSVACLPEVTGGPVLLAQNWDFHPDVLDTTVLLDIRPDAGPRLRMLAEAGQHGRLGFSEEGLGICVNGLDADIETPDQGVPISLLRRTFLMAGSLDALLAPPRTACNNVLVASADGWAVDVELLPASHRTLHPEGGLLAHDNDWGQGARATRLRELLAGRVTGEEVFAALSDHESGICRHDLERPSLTAASVVMDLSARRWRVVRGPPCSDRRGSPDAAGVPDPG